MNTNQAYKTLTSVALCIAAMCFARTATATISVGSGETTYANLNLDADADKTLHIKITGTSGGTAIVTGSLTLPASGTTKIWISEYGRTVNAALKHPLIVAPAGTGLSPDLFTLSLPSPWTAKEKPLAALEVETGGGTETLYLVTREYVTQVATDAFGESAFLPAYASHWNGMSAGDALDAAKIYFAGTESYALRTPNAQEGVVFGGYGLVVGYKVKFYVYAPAVVDRLYAYSPSSIYLGANADRTLGGKIIAANPYGYGEILFSGRKSRTFMIESEISGSADIRFSTASNVTGAGDPTFVVTGTNKAYAGKVMIANDRPETYYTTVRVSDGRNLGGALAAFAYNGIELRNNSLLAVADSATFSEPTRGWHIYGRGRIGVADAAHEARLLSPLTLSGELVKEGDGVLALGGPVRFTPEQATTPVAGTNTLTVAGGWIRPVATNATDGIAFAFSSGTGVVLDTPDAAFEEVASYGLYNVATDSPFDLTDCGETLTFKLDEAATVPDRGLTLAVCTVSATAARTLGDHIRFKRVDGFRTTLSPRSNADGSVTYVAVIEKPGTVMIIH